MFLYDCYICSVIISSILYMKMKILNLQEGQNTILKIIVMTPFLNIIIMGFLFIGYIDEMKELEEMDENDKS